MAESNVNLMHAAPGVPPQTSAMLSQARTVGLICLVAFLAVGLVAFMSYSLVGLQLGQVKARQHSFVTRLKELGQIEALQTIVTSRLAIATNVLSSQSDYTEMLATIGRISDDSGIVELTAQEPQGVSVRLTPRSIAEANELVGRLIALDGEKLISHVIFSSLKLNGDGTIEMVVTFEPRKTQKEI